MKAADSHPLPDFLGIGALKAGTTLLDAMLRNHPQVSMPKHLKEAEYFSRHWERGSQWYANLFAPFDGRLRGEVSPQYMADPRCPSRVRGANPEVKILVSLRHPVDRTVSQYRHYVQETGYARDFSAFLVDHPNAIQRSQYFMALGHWMKFFDRGSIEIIVFDDLVGDPVATIQRVMRFLRIDDSFVPPAAGARVNASFTPKFPRALALAKRAGTRLRAGRGARLIEMAKRAGAGRVLLAPSTRVVESVSDTITPDDLAELSKIFIPDVKRLSDFMGRDLMATWHLCET